MTDLKRTILGVTLHADTDDPAKLDLIRRALDAAMVALRAENARKRLNKAVGAFTDVLKDAGRPK